MYYVENNEKPVEFIVKEQLEQERKDIKSFDDLVAFLQRVKDTCNTGYGTAPRSVAQAALATAWYLCSEFGLTGFQASCVTWDFLEGWSFRDNKCGLKIIDYDNMLYPQYDYKFEKTISKDTFEALQRTAKEFLDEYGGAQRVREHWQSIADGNIPFGYTVTD